MIVSKRLLVASLAIFGLGAGAGVVLEAIGRERGGVAEGLRHQHRSSLADARLPGYEAQKVVYHITEGDAAERGYPRHVLESARNHVRAVGRDHLDLRIVLQGDGVDLLIDAMADKDLAARVDALKSDGVRFLICRNTMVGRGLELSDLHGAAIEDVVGAGVAEVAALEGRGFVYVKP